MTLRKKTLMIVGVTIVVLIGILYFVSQGILLGGFADLEQDEARENVERALGALQDDVAKLESTVGDWAPWDDTYLFVVDGNDDYVENNLMDGTFANLRVNLMLFLDTSGSLVFAKGFDLENEEEVPVTDGLVEAIAANSLLLGHIDTESTVSGLILVPEGPLMVASQPILTSDYRGPIHGTLIMGRYLNSVEISRLAETTRLSLALLRFDDAEIPPDAVAAKSSLANGASIVVQPLDTDVVAGYTKVEDVNGAPILLLEAEMPRAIYHQGLASNRYFMLSLAGVGAVLLALTLLLLERTVLSRLTRLSEDVAGIERSGSISARVSVSGRDELSRLGNGVNRMLAAVEASIAEHNRAEEERRRMEQQLQLAGRLAAVGELAAGVAHELNNPMAAIQGYAELLSEREDLDEVTKSDVETIYREAQRATRITGNLLSFARRHKPRKTLVSINEVVEKSLELHDYRMRVNNIEVVKDLAPALPETMVDFFQMQEVFVNIINNAEQAMTEAHARGRLEVRTQSVNGVIRVSFADDGPGIAEANLKSIFDPFFTTKDVGKGTGLGLSICYGIVQEHGGRIYTVSEPDKGATFVVELRIANGDVPSERQSERT